MRDQSSDGNGTAPQGRLIVAQDEILGRINKNDLVPKGRLRISQDAVLGTLLLHANALIFLSTQAAKAGCPIQACCRLEWDNGTPCATLHLCGSTNHLISLNEYSVLLVKQINTTTSSTPLIWTALAENNPGRKSPAAEYPPVALVPRAFLRGRSGGVLEPLNGRRITGQRRKWSHVEEPFYETSSTECFSGLPTFHCCSPRGMPTAKFAPLHNTHGVAAPVLLVAANGKYRTGRVVSIGRSAHF
jgi:hypothetical protein